MADSQAQTVEMETYSHSNTIILHFGHDHMSKVNPVIEREQAHAYELPMGFHEGRIMLNRKWKLEPPMKPYQYTSMVTKKSSTIVANVTNHGQYTHQRNTGKNTQKGRTSRGILINLRT